MSTAGSGRWRRRSEAQGSLAAPGEAIRGHTAPRTSAGTTHAVQPRAHPCALGAPSRSRNPAFYRLARHGFLPGPDWQMGGSSQGGPEAPPCGQPGTDSESRVREHARRALRAREWAEEGRGRPWLALVLLLLISVFQHQSHLAQHLSLTSYPTGKSLGPKT